MATQDTSCTIMPYFEVQPDNMADFKNLCEQFVEKTASEPGCLYYGFSFRESEVFCREGYENADALMAHIENIGALLEQALQISELISLEIHGPESQLAKLREPLADLPVEYFALEYGFRR